MITEADQDNKSIGNERRAGSKPLGKTLEDLISKFYDSEDYSRQLAGMKDYVKIRGDALAEQVDS